MALTAENKKLIDLANQLEVKVIYDCGSRDALDGLYLLNNIISAEELHIFEPNPIAAQLCKENIQKDTSGKKIFFNEVALANKVGKIKFFPINVEKTITPHPDGNIGASSLLKARDDYPLEKYVQDEIEVLATTFDEYIKKNRSPDLLWMDLQGAELMALSAGLNMLKNVKLIYIEVTFIEIYQNQPLFCDIHKFLSLHGFDLLELEGIYTFWKINKSITTRNLFYKCNLH